MDSKYRRSSKFHIIVRIVFDGPSCLKMCSGDGDDPGYLGERGNCTNCIEVDR